uniref:Uncharacterized protein n=1 Tax=Romanomermis culicivorax TaxID=13658 RepID=A0A915J5V3_ROMCU
MDIFLVKHLAKCTMRLQNVTVVGAAVDKSKIWSANVQEMRPQNAKSRFPKLHKGDLYKKSEHKLDVDGRVPLIIRRNNVKHSKDSTKMNVISMQTMKRNLAEMVLRLKGKPIDRSLQ